MSRRKKIALWIGGSLAGLVLVLAIAAILVVRSSWFEGFVHDKIIAVTEESTGGKVDLASFHFDWTHLRATLRGFVLHGTEPAGAPPLFQADAITVELKLLAGFKQYVDIRSLTVEAPKANIIVYADGSTNVPAPKVKKQSDKSGLETVVDLAIGHFDLHNGYAQLSDRKVPIEAQGRNLRALLQYNTVNKSYQGAIDINPFFLAYGGKQPLDINVHVPVILERDRIQVSDAKIFTRQSQLVLNAAVTNMKSPQIGAHLNGRLALAELRNVSDVKLSPETGKRLPGAVDADIALTMDSENIRLSTARITLGHSEVEASGTLKDPSGKETVQFRASLNVGEVGRIFEIPQRPEGVVQANGNAKLVGSDYQAGGNIQARGLSFREGERQYRDIALNSAFYIDPHKIALNGLKLEAFGGQFAGNAEVLDSRTVKLAGNLSRFNLDTLTRDLTGNGLAYGGVVSGPVEVTGDLSKPGATGFNARANLAINSTSVATSTGVAARARRSPIEQRVVLPVSGKLNVNYNGATNNFEVANSYVSLPSSKLQVSGSLSNAISVRLVSHNLNDFLPLVRMSSPDAELPVTLEQSGTASFDGTITGSTSAPRIAGHLGLTRFALESRSFDRFSADLNAASSGASVQNGALARGGMQAAFSANVGLKNWKPESNQSLRADATIQNGDLADILALAGQKDIQASGALAANAHVQGTIGNPQGVANLTVAKGAIQGEPFDRIQAQVNFADQLVTIPSATIVAGPSNLTLSASFQHPRDSFKTGTIQARVNSNQVQVAQFQSLVKQTPGLSGTAQVNADMTGTLAEVLGQTEFRLTSVNGDASVRGLKAQGQNYGDLTATARTAGNAVSYRVDSDLAGSNINVDGSTRLEPEYPTDATARIANLPIERILALANRRDVKARGNLSADASFHGTLANPQGSAELTLANAVLQDEPVDRIHARVNYTPAAIHLPLLEVTAGPARIAASADYTHKPGDFQDGSLRFRVENSNVDLGRLHTVQQYRPGLAGTVQLAADGAAEMRKTKSGTEFLLTTLNANVNANALQMNGKQFGDLHLTANTRGDRLGYQLQSDFAGASIQGKGETVLRADYVTSAQVTFANIKYSNLRPFILSDTASTADWDAFVEGDATISGPLKRMDDVSGKVTLTRLEVAAARPSTGNGRPVSIHNDGPVVVALNKSVLDIAQAHLTGPQTDININGKAGLTGTRELNVTVRANTDLGLLQQMSRSIYSSGAIVVDAAVRGTMSDPAMEGKVALRDASVNYIDFPNGISHANGTIVLSGSSATIDNLTAESGGGKITMAGTVSYTGGNLSYNNLRATARRVRVRTPQGATVVANANVDLNGTATQSTASGTVTIVELGFSPQSDFGSMLTRGSTPATAPAAPSGPLAGMRLDVRIRTSPSAEFTTPLAQNLEANADLNLRGTAANPGMLGRVDITAGELVFFGNQYTVNQGSISFYDPFRIRPILNIDLQTIAKGVTVVLTVSGPVDNMKLTYHSDPPLQFNEVVALLATGRTPTSDPTLVANQPATPPQTFQQMGESALVSQAIANPVAHRLERVFGVNQLKIDPTFTSGSELPQARLTLQQQVAPNVTFTYITNLAQTNAQIYRVEWALNPNWSAIATREENGRVGVDFFFKKKLR